MKKERVEVQLPEVIVKMLDQYKLENGLTTRTSAIIDLIRKGTQNEKS